MINQTSEVLFAKKPVEQKIAAHETSKNVVLSWPSTSVLDAKSFPDLLKKVKDVKALASCDLSLEGCKLDAHLTGKILSLLHLPQLYKASLKGCNLTNDFLSALAGIFSNLPIQELDLSQNNFSDKGIRDLTVAISSSYTKIHVKKIDLSSSTSKTLLPFSSVFNLLLASRSKTIEVNFDRKNELTNLVEAKLHPQETKLDLTNIHPSNKEEIDTLAGIITTLPLEMVIIPPDLTWGMELFAQLLLLLPNAQFSGLNLHGIGIGDQEAQDLTRLMRVINLKKLDISANLKISVEKEIDIVRECIRYHVEIISPHPFLARVLQSINDRQAMEIFDLSCFGTEDLDLIIEALPPSTWKFTKSLKLRLNAITITQLHKIMLGLSAEQIANLREINLEGNYLGDEEKATQTKGYFVLPTFIFKQGLRVDELNLALNNLGGDGATFLATILERCKIIRLNMGRNAIGNGGAMAFFSRPKVFLSDTSGRKLQKLILAENKLNDDFIDLLCSSFVKSPFTIQGLDFSGNDFSSKGITKLCAIIPEMKLEELNLAGNQPKCLENIDLAALILKSNLKILHLEQLYLSELNLNALIAIFPKIRENLCIYLGGAVSTATRRGVTTETRNIIDKAQALKLAKAAAEVNRGSGKDKVTIKILTDSAYTFSELVQEEIVNYKKSELTPAVKPTLNYRLILFSNVIPVLSSSSSLVTADTCCSSSSSSSSSLSSIATVPCTVKS